MAGITAVYISATSFSFAGTDYTDECMYGRKLLCDCGVNGDKVVTVDSSSWNSNITTVTLIAANSAAITANLESVRFGPGMGTLGSVGATGMYAQSEKILINQDFSIWQEEEAFTNPGVNVYTADGYYVWKQDGGGTAPSVNVKKNTSIHEPAFKQTCELEITNVGVSDSARRWYYNQKLEDYQNYRGKTITLSVRISASTTIIFPGKIIIEDGIGSSSAIITSIETDSITYLIEHTVADNATKVQGIFAICSGAGEISTTGSIYIQWMKLELGSVATPLIPRKTGDDLNDSQRHYQKTYAQGVFPGATTEIGAVWQEITAVADADHTITIDVKFPKIMKAAPTITLYDLAGNSGRVSMAAGDNIVGTVSQISDSGFKISATNGAAATSRKIAFHYTAISRV